MTEVYRVGFFGCTVCGFKLSLVGGQANYEVANGCPSCGESMEYLEKKEREEYMQALKDELNYML